jgi:3',5'-cyclic AMP phosphodiesterase CpdA
LRLALLADVHGNLPAFEAALAAARREAPDLLVVAGDVVNGGPDSRACWQLARAEADLLLRGNHERYAIDRGTAAGDPAWLGPRFRPLAWTVAELAGLLDDVRAVPIEARVDDAVYVMHAAPGDDHAGVFPWTPDDELVPLLAGVDAELLLRAHNHLPFHRTLPDGRLLVSAGAVGLALAGRPEAQWALLTRGRVGWRVEHRSTPYDVAAALRRFDDSGYLDAAGPVGILFRREAATGSHQLVPFMRFERAWREARGLPDDDDTLAAALAAFLSRGG